MQDLIETAMSVLAEGPTQLKKFEFKTATIVDSKGEEIKGILEADVDEDDLWWVVTKQIGEGPGFWMDEVKTAMGSGSKVTIRLSVPFSVAGK